MTEAPSIILCPYCGHTQKAPADRCGGCGGHFDPLSRKVTQQHMGPWFIRDLQSPHRPGCSYQTLKKMIGSGKIKPETVMRGPTTRQFWTVAWRVPGVAHLIGFCHRCEEPITKGAGSCPRCNEPFPNPENRNRLGVDPLDPTVMQQVQQARSAAASASAPVAAASSSPAKTASGPQSVEEGAAYFGGEQEDQAAPSAEAVEWMEASAGLEMGDFETSASPIRRSKKNKSGQLIFGLILANLILVFAVVAVVYLGETSNEPLVSLSTPPKPKAKQASPGNEGKTNKTNSNGASDPDKTDTGTHPSDTQPDPPNGNASNGNNPPNPPEPTAPPKPRIFKIDPNSAVSIDDDSGGATFFGIPIGKGNKGNGAKITKQQVLKIIQRFNKTVIDFETDGKERQALADLKELRRSLPKNIRENGGGMGDAIQAMEKWIQEANP